jgi:hypothetical protein
MQQASFARRRRNSDARGPIVRKPPGYSRYTDPDIFPRFGGDEFDPPPYSTDRRPNGAAPPASGPRPGADGDGLSMLVETARSIPQLLFRNLNALFAAAR